MQKEERRRLEARRRQLLEAEEEERQRAFSSADDAAFNLSSSGKSAIRGQQRDLSSDMMGEGVSGRGAGGIDAEGGRGVERPSSYHGKRGGEADKVELSPPLPRLVGDRSAAAGAGGGAPRHESRMINQSPSAVAFEVMFDGNEGGVKDSPLNLAAAVGVEGRGVGAPEAKRKGRSKPAVAASGDGSDLPRKRSGRGPSPSSRQSADSAGNRPSRKGWGPPVNLSELRAAGAQPGPTVPPSHPPSVDSTPSPMRPQHHHGMEKRGPHITPVAAGVGERLSEAAQQAKEVDDDESCVVEAQYGECGPPSAAHKGGDVRGRALSDGAESPSLAMVVEEDAELIRVEAERRRKRQHEAREQAKEVSPEPCLYVPCVHASLSSPVLQVLRKLRDQKRWEAANPSLNRHRQQHESVQGKERNASAIVKDGREKGVVSVAAADGATKSSSEDRVAAAVGGGGGIEEEEEAIRRYRQEKLQAVLGNVAEVQQIVDSLAAGREKKGGSYGSSNSSALPQRQSVQSRQSRGEVEVPTAPYAVAAAAGEERLGVGSGDHSSSNSHVVTTNGGRGNVGEGDEYDYSSDELEATLEQWFVSESERHGGVTAQKHSAAGSAAGHRHNKSEQHSNIAAPGDSELREVEEVLEVVTPPPAPSMLHHQDMYDDKGEVLVTAAAAATVEAVDYWWHEGEGRDGYDAGSGGDGYVPVEEEAKEGGGMPLPTGDNCVDDDDDAELAGLRCALASELIGASSQPRDARKGHP